MTDVKRLLDEATPLPWTVDRPVAGGWKIQGPKDTRWGAAVADSQNAALIVYAVNHLPDYEAAVDALEWFVQFHSGHVLPPDLTNAMRAGRAALRRLRGES